VPSETWVVVGTRRDSRPQLLHRCRKVLLYERSCVSPWMGNCTTSEGVACSCIFLCLYWAADWRRIMKLLFCFYFYITCMFCRIFSSIYSVLYSVSPFNGHFPGEPGLASFIGAEDDGSGGDNWSYKSCKAPVKSSPPTNQHQAFYGLDALPVAQLTVSKHWSYVIISWC